MVRRDSHTEDRGHPNHRKRRETGDGRVSEREREHTIQPWPSQTTRSRPAPVHHPPSIAQRIIRHPEEGPSIGGAEWVTDAVPSHPHPIRSCRSKPIMPVSMRAPDGRVFVGKRVRRVIGEDIRGDARARSPHGLCGRACTAGGSHEADTCMRGACNACGGRVGWYAETHKSLRTVAIPTIARDERQESE